MTRRKRQRFGQHFLADARAVSGILGLVDEAPPRVLEIGPGRGALTGGLLRKVEHVTALEMDESLAPRLEERFAGTGLDLVLGDALEVDLDALCGAARPWQVVGNLPYSVGSAILRRLLPRHDLFTKLVIMLQREVAERIVAQPGQREHGLLALERAAWAEARIVFDLPPRVFRPRPRVVSSVLAIRLRPPEVTSAEVADALRLAGHALLHPRKTVANAIKPMVEADRLTAAEIDPMARPGTLSLAAWCRLARTA
jgi:16S rRNA (adenine1518-N6/adenine1519-N6)-dimethyltransferase